MTDRDAMIRSILESPHDDVPRLIFADWLEDHGEAARAEFIRVQVELARSKHEPTCRGDIHVSGGLGIRCNCRVSELHRRERELFTHDAIFDWFPMPTDRTGTTCRRKRNEIAFVQFESAGLRDREGRHAPATEQTYHVSRGFVSSIHCSWYDFLRRHESLVWSPEQLTVSRFQQHNPASMQRKTVLCKDGRIQCPFVATAQPITDVALTTWPTWLENRTHFDAVRLGVNSFVTTVTTDGHRFDRVKCETCGGCGYDRHSTGVACDICHGIPPNSWTCPAWPGVKFAMPNSGDPT